MIALLAFCSSNLAVRNWFETFKLKGRTVQRHPILPDACYPCCSNNSSHFPTWTSALFIVTSNTGFNSFFFLFLSFPILSRRIRVHRSVCGQVSGSLRAHRHQDQQHDTAGRADTSEDAAECSGRQQLGGIGRNACEVDEISASRMAVVRGIVFDIRLTLCEMLK